MKNAARKGNEKAREFDRMAVVDWRWLKLAGEHRFRWGGMCNVAGFDRLYATPEGPTLVEITVSDRRVDHFNAIIERLKREPLLEQNFRIILVVYYGGHKRLSKAVNEPTWTKAGTWSYEQVHNWGSEEFKR